MEPVAGTETETPPTSWYRWRSCCQPSAATPKLSRGELPTRIVTPSWGFFFRFSVQNIANSPAISSFRFNFFILFYCNLPLVRPCEPTSKTEWKINTNISSPNDIAKIHFYYIHGFIATTLSIITDLRR